MRCPAPIDSNGYSIHTNIDQIIVRYPASGDKDGRWIEPGQIKVLGVDIIPRGTPNRFCQLC